MAQKVCCRLEQVIDHGERVYSLLLRSERPLPRFQPGQFLHLALEDYQPGDFWPDSRPFSIASSPADRQSLRLTYAVKGSYTSRMEKELVPGREVWVKLPHGEFTIGSAPQTCLVAGGTGVTAFTAFIAGLAPAYPGHIQLMYGARRSELLIYRSVVEEAWQRCPNLSIRYFIEEGAGEPFLAGRIDAARVWQELPDPLMSHFYLSGPPAMLQTLRQSLEQMGLPGNQIHIDAWE